MIWKFIEAVRSIMQAANCARVTAPEGTRRCNVKYNEQLFCFFFVRLLFNVPLGRACYGTCSFFFFFGPKYSQLMGLLNLITTQYRSNFTIFSGEYSKTCQAMHGILLVGLREQFS